jgi:aspartyl-tRNA(Asn)/glutamyl-tRNA(Gln) amidotransferase subunit A
MLNQLTLKQAIDKIAAGETTAQEINQAVLKEIEKSNPELNVYLSLDEEIAQKSDPESEKQALKGLAIGVKDNFATKGLRTTASSTLLDEFIPEYESTVTDRLKKAGGRIIGKTNLDAWAHGSSTETSQYGPTLNPRNTDYLPGGSSGGSAAAVAADMCIAALGTETAGSVRGPASHCGIVGLKPTYGRVPRYGVVAMASSTDSPGPMTKTVEDAAILLNHIAGHDPKDGTTSTKEVPDFTQFLNKDIKGLKIGWIYADLPGLEGNKAIYEQQAQVLRDLGAEVELAPAMDPKLAISVYTIVQRGEVSSNLARFDGVRYGNDRSYFGEEAQRRIMLGTYTLSKGYADQYYNTAQKVRTLFRQDFEKLFKKYDVLISATVPGYAHPIGASEKSAMFGELEDMLMEANSLVGLPGISVPCYHNKDTNLFLGLNIMAPMFREDLIIKVADTYEKATTWNTWRK